MAYLTGNELVNLGNAILNSVGYPDAIRRIFLSEVNKSFRNILFVFPQNEKAQLDLDLAKINDTPRLTDGSIPFQAWLNRAAQYVQQFPDANKIVQETLAKIEGIAVKTGPVEHIQSPSPVVVNKIIQEKIIQQNDMVSFSFLEAGFKAGNAVVRLRVPRFDNGTNATLPDGSAITFSGTGWLLTKQLLITNYHVVNARGENESNASESDFNKQGENMWAEFDFNNDNMIPLVVAVNKLEVADETLDFAVLRLKDPIQRIPAARFPQEIFAVAGHPQVVNIIQHPFGHSKKVAFRNNHIFEVKYPKVYYFTDTEKGSSGSPVFNDNWQVIALHRASQLVQDVNYQGKSTGWINEGVQLKAIFDFLRTNKKAIADEITNN